MKASIGGHANGCWLGGQCGLPRVQFASPEGENGSSSSDDFTIEYNINDIQETKPGINYNNDIT